MIGCQPPADVVGPTGRARRATRQACGFDLPSTENASEDLTVRWLSFRFRFDLNYTAVSRRSNLRVGGSGSCPPGREPRKRRILGISGESWQRGSRGGESARDAIGLPFQPDATMSFYRGRRRTEPAERRGAMARCGQEPVRVVPATGIGASVRELLGRPRAAHRRPPKGGPARSATARAGCSGSSMTGYGPMRGARSERAEHHMLIEACMRRSEPRSGRSRSDRTRELVRSHVGGGGELAGPECEPAPPRHVGGGSGVAMRASMWLCNSRIATGSGCRGLHAVWIW